MKYWIYWGATLVVYGTLNYLSVWGDSAPGLFNFFMWGTTLPIAAIITWGAILIPRRVILPSKKILGVLTVLAYGALGILSFWTITNMWGSV